MRRSSWKPLSLHRAVTLCRRAQDLLDRQGIGVIRMGLQPSIELEKQVVAGPYHPAFGELVQGTKVVSRNQGNAQENRSRQVADGYDIGPGLFRLCRSAQAESHPPSSPAILRHAYR